MPNLNIEVDASLLRAINLEATKRDLTQRDWVIGVLAKQVGWEVGNGFDRDAARVQRDNKRKAGHSEDRVKTTETKELVSKAVDETPEDLGLEYDLCIQCRVPLESYKGRARCPDCANTFPQLSGKRYA